MLEEKVKEWEKTKSISLATEICEMLSVRPISDELFQDVVNWGREKGINNSDKQLCKVQEEIGEIAHELCRGNYHSEEMQDSIGDTAIALTILADTLDFDILFCMQEAYDTIRNRTGKNLDGCFIKEEDLNR